MSRCRCDDGDVRWCVGVLHVMVLCVRVWWCSWCWVLLCCDALMCCWWMMQGCWKVDGQVDGQIYLTYLSDIWPIFVLFWPFWPICLIFVIDLFVLLMGVMIVWDRLMCCCVSSWCWRMRVCVSVMDECVMMVLCYCQTYLSVLLSYCQTYLSYISPIYLDIWPKSDLFDYILENHSDLYPTYLWNKMHLQTFYLRYHSWWEWMLRWYHLDRHIMIDVREWRCMMVQRGDGVSDWCVVDVGG